MPGHVTCTCLVAELARGSTLYSWSLYMMLLQGSVFCIIISERINFVLMVFLHDVAPGISFLNLFLRGSTLYYVASRNQYIASVY